MPDVTLGHLRRAIRSLSDDGGRYCLVCASTGERPIPVARSRFATRANAATAARLAARYRDLLRERDPRVARHDLIACEAPALGSVARRSRRDEGDGPAVGGDVSDVHGRVDDHGGSDVHDRTDYGDASDVDGTPAAARTRIRFCHDVAGAVFETLRESGLGGVEAGVMGAYVSAADEFVDPDELCLHLVDRTAAALRQRRSRRERAAVCRDAAARLPAPAVDAGFPLVGAFERLATVDLLEGFSVSPWEVDADGPVRSCAAAVDGYAIAPRDGAVTTLPLVLDVLRRRPDAAPILAPVARLPDDRLEFRLASSDGGDPAGIARVPLRE